VWLDRERTGEDAGASVHVYRAVDVAGAVDGLVENESPFDRSPIGASA
jgi:hypothetical protein